MKYWILAGLLFVPGICFASKAPSTDIHVIENPCQKWYSEPMNGCIRYSNGRIELDAGMPEDYIYWNLYHEQGHWFTHTKLGRFKRMTRDEEEIADNFAEWITGVELEDEWATQFEEVCDAECVGKIKSIKLK